VPVLLTLRVKLCRANVAVTDWAAFMVTVQVPVPLQAPLQPVNVELGSGVAVSVTMVPLAKLAEQVAPQLIPAGLLVTVPVPVPVLLTESEKLCRVLVPLPDKLTVCGLPVALSVIDSVPVLVPVVVGVKVTLIVQLAPVLSLAVPLFASEKSPLAVMVLMFTVLLPVLVSVTACGVLVVPTGWLAKVRVLLDSVTV